MAHQIVQQLKKRQDPHIGILATLKFCLVETERQDQRDVIRGDTAISLHTPVRLPCTIFGGAGGLLLASVYPKFSMKSTEFFLWGGGILDKLLPKVPKSSMRSSKFGLLPEVPKSSIFWGGGGIFGKLLPKVSKSSMRSSKLGVGRGILYQKYPILCNFDNKIFILDLALALHVWRLKSAVQWNTTFGNILCVHFGYCQPTLLFIIGL